MLAAVPAAVVAVGTVLLAVVPVVPVVPVVAQQVRQLKAAVAVQGGSASTRAKPYPRTCPIFPPHQIPEIPPLMGRCILPFSEANTR